MNLPGQYATALSRCLRDSPTVASVGGRQGLLLVTPKNSLEVSSFGQTRSSTSPLNTSNRFCYKERSQRARRWASPSMVYSSGASQLQQSCHTELKLHILVCTLPTIGLSPSSFQPHNAMSRSSTKAGSQKFCRRIFMAHLVHFWQKQLSNVAREILTLISTSN